MRRVSWILGIGAALVMAWSVESTSSTLQRTPATLHPSSTTTPDQLQINGDELSPGASGIICPELPPDCCIIRVSGGCKLCTQTGC